MPPARPYALAALALTLLGAGPGRAVAAPGAAAAPASQPAARAPATQPAPPPLAAAPGAQVAPAPLPTRLGVAADRGWFVPSILVQAWFQLDRYTGSAADAGQVCAGTGGRDCTTSTFRLRRAEIAARGEILKGRLAYGIVLDPARILDPVTTEYTTSGGETVSVPSAPKGTAVTMLQDAWVGLLTAYADVTVGQFKIPVSLEGLGSSAGLIFPERGAVAKKWGDKRDIGIKVQKTFKYFGYHVGLYNGQGGNNLDVNNSKDVAARLEAYPIRGLTVAGVVYHELKASSTVYQKRRYEADLRFERRGFLFQGEYIYGVDQARTDATDRHGQGFYATLAYVLLGGRLQPAVRVGLVDPDLARGKDYTLGYEAGVNWYIHGRYAKLQLAYARFQETAASGKKSTNDVVLAVQGHY